MKLAVLIRGVTPTGKNKVPMAQLRELLGVTRKFTSVQTYIQSGNVIVETELSIPETERVVHDIILDNFGGDLVVIAKNHEQLQRSFENYPIESIPTERRYYTFLKSAPTDEGLQKLAERDFGEDKYHVVGDMVYIAYATKASDSKLTNNVIEQKLGVSATTRNYNTVKKLVELST
ncbi:MAG: DUF1697 domain-containing protein [Candidatus Saccharimonas sp.]